MFHLRSSGFFSTVHISTTGIVGHFQIRIVESNYGDEPTQQRTQLMLGKCFQHANEIGQCPILLRLVTKTYAHATDYIVSLQSLALVCVWCAHVFVRWIMLVECFWQFSLVVSIISDVPNCFCRTGTVHFMPYLQSTSIASSPKLTTMNGIIWYRRQLLRFFTMEIFASPTWRTRCDGGCPSFPLATPRRARNSHRMNTSTNEA